MSFLEDTLRGSIDRIVVETTLTPPIIIDRPFEPGPPSPLLQLLKPRYSLYLKGASAPLVMKPYGDPEPNRWPAVQIALIAGALALGGVGLVAVGRLLMSQK